jgi:GNAT superfamily N-acetyltransferase
MKIVQIPFEIAVSAGLVAAAKKAKVSIRQRDIVFVVEGVRAVGCLRKMNSLTVRLCGCWVAEDQRGKGYGKALVEHRFKYACQNTSAKKVDTFAFRNVLFEKLGFVPSQKFKIGTTHLVYEVPKEVIAERNKWDSAYWQQ